jgi:hypothetical protein
MQPHYTQFGHVDAIKVGLKNDAQEPVRAVITASVTHKKSDSEEERQGQGSTEVVIDPLGVKDELLPLETSILIKGNKTSYDVSIEIV